MPFVIAGLKEYDCHHGKDHNISKKNKAKIEKVMLVFLLSFLLAHQHVMTYFLLCHKLS